MIYDYPVYRPPSEAYSLILQVAIGCSHNACTFCTMYKTKRYRQKSWEEIKKLIESSAGAYPRASRIFLADGNALSLPIQTLVQTLEMLRRCFPRLERISIYGGPHDILSKTKEELALLGQKGLDLVYLGIESGSEKVLKMVKKGVSPQEMTEAGRKVIDSGLGLSATIISGLGGKELWEEHAVETARVASAINPHYLASLTLLLENGAPLLSRVQKGEFSLLTPWEVLRETRKMIENLELHDCVYRSNHASNYFSLACVLNREKEDVLSRIDKYLERPDIKALPIDYYRRL